MGIFGDIREDVRAQRLLRVGIALGFLFAALISLVAAWLSWENAIPLLFSAQAMVLIAVILIVTSFNAQRKDPR